MKERKRKQPKREKKMHSEMEVVGTYYDSFL